MLNDIASVNLGEAGLQLDSLPKNSIQFSLGWTYQVFVKFPKKAILD